MTKEELKEAINATIVENGQKGITAQVLADILNEIVESSGSGGGLSLNSMVNIDMTTFEISITSDPNEANAQVFQKIKEGAANGVAYPVNLFMDASSIEDGVYFIDTVAFITPSIDFTYLELITLYTSELGVSSLSLYEDGSITTTLLS